MLSFIGHVLLYTAVATLTLWLTLGFLLLVGIATGLLN